MTATFRASARIARRTAMGIVVGLTAWAVASPAQAFDRESLVSKKCTACHPAGADGRIARVEDIRTTPEEWAVIVDRMKRLHGMEIKDGEMDRLLKELCATQILTPDEQAKVAYLSLWHNSQQMEVPSGKDEEKLFTTCVRCHTEGKIRSYRMTAESWTKLRDFHLYIGADGPAPDARNALGSRGRRGARIVVGQAAVRQGVVGAGREARGQLGGVRV